MDATITKFMTEEQRKAVEEKEKEGYRVEAQHIDGPVFMRYLDTDKLIIISSSGNVR